MANEFLNEEKQVLDRTNYKDSGGEYPFKFAEVVGAKWWIDYYVGDRSRGFRHEPAAFIFFKKILLALVSILENILGEQIFIKRGNLAWPIIEPRLLEMLKRMFEEKIIYSVSRTRVRPDMPLPFVGYSFSPGVMKTPLGAEIRLNGSFSGEADTANEGLMKAIAELLERQSLCAWDLNRITVGSYEKLGSLRAADPLQFRVFSDEQINKDIYTRRERYFNEKTEFEWIGARSLLSGKKILIPAALSFVRYRSRKPEPFLREVNSSGAGAGTSFAMAAYSAVCESIERDAIMIYWLNKITPPMVDQSTIKDERIMLYLDNLQKYQFEVKIFELSNEFMPVYLVISFDKTGYLPGISVSSAADLNSHHALFHALREHIKIIQSDRFSATEDKLAGQENIPIVTIQQRRMFWFRKNAAEDICWMWENNNKRAAVPPDSFASDSFEERLSEVRHRFQKKNIDSYLVDISMPIASEFGLKVIMSVCTALYPLYFDESIKYLGVQRLFTFPVEFGYLSSPKKVEELNTIPHPVL